MGQINYTTAEINVLLGKADTDLEVILGTTDPTTSTEAVVNQLYVNKTNSSIWVCTAISIGVLETLYTWQKVSISTSDIANLPASVITSGTFPDARISSAATWNAKQAEHSKVTGTLTTAGWSNNTQTINVTGVTATNTVIVSPAPASQEDYANSAIYCTAQGAGTLTFTCEDVPTNAITVNVVILD